MIENSRRLSARRKVQVIVPTTFLSLALLVLVCLYYQFHIKHKQQQGIYLLVLINYFEAMFWFKKLLLRYFKGILENKSRNDPEIRSDDEDLELPLFDLSTILKATNNLSVDVKLGEGGYGPVYKVMFNSIYVVHIVFMCQYILDYQII